MNRLNRTFVVGVVVSLLSIGMATALAKPKKGGGGGGGGSGGQDGSNFPPPTTSPSGNSSQITQDLADLKAAQTAVEETFETSSEWLAALAAVKQAQSDYDDACGPVMDALKLQPAYQSATDAQAKADANLKDLQTTGSPDDISNAAQTAMAARSTVKSMEAKALLADPGTVAAKQRLTAANAAVAQLKEKEQDAVHTDPTWLAAKKKLDDARGH